MQTDVEVPARRAAVRLDPLVRRFRWLNWLYANLLGYYWAACPICGQMYGGHEIADQGLNTGPLEECKWRCTDETGKELGTMPGYMWRGRCVCWRCGERAAQLNRERDTSNKEIKTKMPNPTQGDTHAATR
jgi:hypothetical protein